MNQAAAATNSQAREISSKGWWKWPVKEVLLSLILVIASHVFVVSFSRLAQWERGSPAHLLGEYCQWDCGWYAQIIQSGYESQPHAGGSHDAASWHFLPLFPLSAMPLSRWFGVAPGLAAVLASKFFLFTAILSFLWMVRDDRDNLSDAVLAGTLVAFNPYVIYAHGGYAESLYFTIAAAGFAFLSRERWVASGLAGGLLSATRIVGVAFVVPYVIASLRKYGISRLIRAQRLDIFVGVLLCPAGLSLYLLYLYHLTGDALAPIHSFVAWGVTSGNPVAIIGEGLRHGHWTRYWAWTAIVGWIASAWLAQQRKIEMAVFLAHCILLPATAEVGGMPRFVWWQPPMLYAVFLLLKRYPRLQMIYAAFAGGMAATMVFLWSIGSNAVV